MKKLICIALALTVFVKVSAQQALNKDALPQGFVYVTDLMPDVLLEIRYYSTYNFVGARVDGYLAPVAILSVEAARALLQVRDELKERGYLIKIFDAYRPQKGVNHFVNIFD